MQIGCSNETLVASFHPPFVSPSLPHPFVNNLSTPPCFNSYLSVSPPTSFTYYPPYLFPFPLFSLYTFLACTRDTVDMARPFVRIFMLLCFPFSICVCMRVVQLLLLVSLLRGLSRLMCLFCFTLCMWIPLISLQLKEYFNDCFPPFLFLLVMRIVGLQVRCEIGVVSKVFHPHMISIIASLKLYP
jgi:hypothetical protein